ncbi:GIY-YIG nuclease family protein [Pseudomonas gorinensis]
MENPSIVEREIHDELYIQRINDNCEFFRGTTSFMETYSAGIAIATAPPPMARTTYP